MANEPYAESHLNKGIKQKTMRSTIIGTKATITGTVWQLMKDEFWEYLKHFNHDVVFL